MSLLDLPKRDPILNAFSVDVEDYFQVGAFESLIGMSDWESFEPRVEENTLRILDLLGRFRTTGTFFVLGWVAERWPGLIAAIADAGHELGVHGYDHRRVTVQTPDEFRSDVRRTKRMLEDISGSEVIGFRAPNYSIVEKTMWALDILLEEGFTYDSSIFPITHDHYGIPDAPRFPWVYTGPSDSRLLEVPVSTVRIAGRNLPFVGGGYLRHFPMWFVLWGMRRLNGKERQPVVVYIHPWEVDPDQPRIDAPALTRLRHYRNLHRTEARLEQLFETYRFTAIRTMIGL